MERIEAEHPRPRHFLLHLSDPTCWGPQPLHGVIDSEAMLKQLFAEVLASGARPEGRDFHRRPGRPRRTRSVCQAPRHRGSGVQGHGGEGHLGDGNHDDQANFRSGLLDQTGNDAPLDHSYFVNGLRIITLDTSVPGFHHGELARSSWTGSLPN